MRIHLSVVSVVTVAFLLSLAAYAIHKNYGFKAALNTFGLSFTLEADKPEARDSTKK